MVSSIQLGDLEALHGLAQPRVTWRPMCLGPSPSQDQALAVKTCPLLHPCFHERVTLGSRGKIPSGSTRGWFC